ncbi:MAG: ParB/RepB/Spo0J family partition protein [Pyrinomonadaceae bacterium]
MSRKVLGKGLSALITQDAGMSRDNITEIDIDLITPNPQQPRIRFPEEKLEELAQSIKNNGIIQPIVVREKDGSYEIVAGERRWRSAQRVGLQKVPVVVRQVSDEKLLEIALIENIQRQELNAIEEAKAYRKLIDSLGLTQEMVADRVGKNRTVITTFLRLLKLPDEVLKLIEEEKISAGHGRALLLTDDGEAQKRIAHMIVEMSLSVREAEKAVKRVKRDGGKIVEKQKTKIDANTKAAETKLKRHLGTNVSIIPDGNGTGGKIFIEYYGESDLDRIYKIILKK